MAQHQGRGGDAAKRQANNLARTGVFDLLATVAGQILQDAGSEDPNKTKQLHQDAFKEKAQSDIDSQITSLESVKDFSSVDKPQSAGKTTVNADVCTIKDVSDQGSNDLETVSCVVRTPSQEEERKIFVKNVLVDEGNGAPVHMNASPLEDPVNILTMLDFTLSFILFLALDLCVPHVFIDCTRFCFQPRTSCLHPLGEMCIGFQSFSSRFTIIFEICIFPHTLVFKWGSLY